MTNKQPYIYKEDTDGNMIAVRNESYWKQKAVEKYLILLKRSGIPEFYWNIDWKDYRGTKSKINFDKALKYSQQFTDAKFDHVHLYMWSELNSSQKTAIACNIGKDLIQQGAKVKFILGGTLIDWLMKNNGFNYHEEIYNNILDLKEQDLLIIDDAFSTDKGVLWKNSSNNNLIVAEWDRTLREIVSSNTKIIVTSNMPMDKIREMYSISMYELIDRNFVPLLFEDSIKEHKKKKFDNLWG